MAIANSKPRRSLVAFALILAVAVLPGPWGGERVPPPGVLTSGTPGDPGRGARLFARLDCVRCHTEPRSGGGVDIPPSLAFAGSRARAEWMATWMRDPEPLRFAADGVRPDLCMPAVPVSSQEAEDLAAYLSTVTKPLFDAVPRDVSPDDSTLVSRGKELFEQYQCLGCHRLGDRGREVGPALDAVGRRRRPSYVMALLQDPNAVVPGTAMKDFDLWPEEIEALTGFLMSLGGTRPATPSVPE